MQLKCKKKIFMQCYGEGAVADRTCQKWFAKFCAGDFSLDGTPSSGRPVEVDSYQIKALIENNQHFTMWEIANILKISKSIKLLVKMKHYLSFTKKNHTDFLANPIYIHMKYLHCWKQWDHLIWNTSWKDLQSMFLSEKSKSKDTMYSMIPFMFLGNIFM